MAQKTAYAVFLLAVVALLLEVLLRWSGAYLLYTEKGGGYFIVEYDRSYNHNHRFTYARNDSIRHKTFEFDYPCQTNEFGFRDKPLKDLDTARFRPLLFIGDSFIEGIGANCDATLPRHFERLYDPDSMFVFSAGISGSDVFYSYKVLEQDLPVIRPVLVLQGLNVSDIFEHVTRGGFERFHPGGLSVHRDAPVNLRLYRNSHLFRWYIHEVRRLSRYTFLRKKALVIREAEAESAIVDAIRRTDSLVTAHGARYIVFIYPTPYHLDKNTPEPELERIHEACRRNGVQSLLLTGAFEHLTDSLGEGFSELYWPFDGHYNEAGYGEFARILKGELDTGFPDWRSRNNANSSNR